MGMHANSVRETGCRKLFGQIIMRLKCDHSTTSAIRAWGQPPALASNPHATDEHSAPPRTSELDDEQVEACAHRSTRPGARSAMTNR